MILQGTDCQERPRKGRPIPPERRAELEVMLKRMEQASSAFYYLAVQVGHHAFIEFTGLMNEYINVCRDTMNAGVDFTLTTAHGDGVALTFQGYQRKYLAEKLTCIFQTSFPALMEGTADV